MSTAIRPWLTLGAALARAARWPFRVAAARATLNALARMDRRELADIGLTRADLADATALALDRDPTVLLARRARERRRGAFAPPTAAAAAGWGEARASRAASAGGAVRTGSTAPRTRSPSGLA